ncbi:MAG: orotate phosphoribosyltransferase [Chitinophagaceae bacterium]|nr:orotate phosphoribosyltransferase [Chitinophagaceae bacterium]
MIGSESVAVKMAALLLQINAVKLSLHQPFTWSSGWKSPIYCDNRLTLSFPEIRTFIKESLAELIKEKFPDVELLAGVATAGIAHGALIADALETPFCYVRSSAKEHGLGNKIEGLALPGQKVVVVEDLVSTGGSSLSVVNALREAGCEVIGMVAIFNYGFPMAEQNFTQSNCPCYTLTDYETLVKASLKKGTVAENEVHSLELWRLSPSTWEGLQ